MSGEFWVGPAHDPDRIRLGAATASGAEGVLYRGFVDLPDGPVPLAVKMLHPGHLPRLAEWTARWRDQVRLLREVELPGLVAVRGGFVGPLPHAAGKADGSTATLYLVMDWVEGVALDQWARSLDDPEPEQLLVRLVAVAAALDLLHSGAATGGQPVVHRDVKPANILVRPDGDTVLVDLGSIRGLLGGHGRASLVGTAGYIAPEVLADGRFGPAADRYSLGAVAYFLLTGEEPVSRPAPGEHRRRLLAAPMLDGRADLADHVAAMLDPEPDRRPQCLANWVAQMRRSSLSHLPGDVPLPRRAATRHPSTLADPGPAEVGPAGRSPTERVAGRRRRALLAVAAIAALSLTITTIALARQGESVRDGAPVAQSTGTSATEEPVTTSTDVPTTTGPVPTTVGTVTASTTTTSRPSPVVAPSAPGSVTPTTSLAAPPQDPRYRAAPAMTASNESYVVEILADLQGSRLSAAIRRQDLQGASSPGPDDFPVSYASSWIGSFGRRCLTVGGSGMNMSTRDQPPHSYAYGVVGLDAVKVELVGSGRRITATLGAQSPSTSARWWIADHAGTDITQVVATDGSGQTWSVTGLIGLYGQTGC